MMDRPFAIRHECRLDLTRDTKWHHGVQRGDALTVLRAIGCYRAGSAHQDLSSTAKLLAPVSDLFGSFNYSAIYDQLSTFNFRSIDNQFGLGNWF